LAPINVRQDFFYFVLPNLVATIGLSIFLLLRIRKGRFFVLLLLIHATLQITTFNNKYSDFLTSLIRLEDQCHVFGIQTRKGNLKYNSDLLRSALETELLAKSKSAMSAVQLSEKYPMWFIFKNESNEWTSICIHLSPQNGKTVIRLITDQKSIIAQTEFDRHVLDAGPYLHYLKDQSYIDKDIVCLARDTTILKKNEHGQFYVEMIESKP
jgi:hypothetical protein